MKHLVWRLQTVLCYATLYCFDFYQRQQHVIFTHESRLPTKPAPSFILFLKLATVMEFIFWRGVSYWDTCKITSLKCVCISTVTRETLPCRTLCPIVSVYLFPVSLFSFSYSHCVNTFHHVSVGLVKSDWSVLKHLNLFMNVVSCRGS